MTPEEIEKKEIVLKYFESSQQDFRQKVDLKQGVLLAYAGATAALVAFVIQQYATHREVVYFLLAIPMFSLLAACHFADHMLATTGVADYQLHELKPQLPERLKRPEMLHESGYLNPLKSIFWALQLGELMLIGLPSFGSLLAVGVFLYEQWSSNSTVVRWGVISIGGVDCACLYLSVFLLRKVTENTKVFAGSNDKSNYKSSPSRAKRR